VERLPSEGVSKRTKFSRCAGYTLIFHLDQLQDASKEYLIYQKLDRRNVLGMPELVAREDLSRYLI